MGNETKAQALAEKLMGRGDAGGTGDVAYDAIMAGVATNTTSSTSHPNQGREPGDGKAEALKTNDNDADADDDTDNIDGEVNTDDEATENSDDDGEELSSEEEEAEDEDNGSEDTREFAYYDDDLIEVTVDGEAREVSLKDLKAAYSGEGAISKRLQEATEERKAAHTERQQVVQETAVHRETLMRTIQQLDQLIFAGVVSPPDPKLRARDMNEYLMHKDAYEEDQKRIAIGRQQVQEWFRQENQRGEASRVSLMNYEGDLLRKAAPELTDKESATKFQRYVKEAVDAYGFTLEEVNSAMSHKLFLMARDAGKWITMQKAKKLGVATSSNESGDGAKAKPRKLLKAGNGTVTQLKMASKKGLKERQETISKARSTGRPDDVAAMILATARTKQTGAKNGR
jgi:hypothetical protein